MQASQKSSYADKLMLLEATASSLFDKGTSENVFEEFNKKVSKIKTRILNDQSLDLKTLENISAKLGQYFAVSIRAEHAFRARISTNAKTISPETFRIYLYNAIPNALEATLKLINKPNLLTSKDLADMENFIFNALITITMAKLLRESMKYNGINVDNVIITENNCPDLFKNDFSKFLNLKKVVCDLDDKSYSLLLEGCLRSGREDDDSDAQQIPKHINGIVAGLNSVATIITQLPKFKALFGDVVIACQAFC